MKNKTFWILIGILLTIVFATMLIIRTYNPSQRLQILEQEELARIAEIKSLLGEAYIFYYNGDYNAAEKKVHFLLRRVPRNIAALQLLGNIFFMQKKYDDAEKIFRRILEFDQPRAINHNNLGQTLAMLGNFPEAITELKKAAILKPDIPQPYLNLAETYIKLKNKKNAIRYLKKAIEASKNKNNITINLNSFRTLKDEPEFQKILMDMNSQTKDKK